MEELRQLGVYECTSKELVARLLPLQISSLQRLRCSLFEDAKSANLVGHDDVIVQRQKRAIGPSKLPTDIATLVYHLRNKEYLPRTLLRNGKSSKQRYEQLKCQLLTKGEGMKKPAKKGTNKSGMKPISARRNE